MVGDSGEAFIRARHSMERVRRARSSRAGFDMEVWRELAALGWTGALLSESVGGVDLGLGAALPIATICGRHLLPEPFVATAVIAATVLSRCETAAGRGLAAAVASGEVCATLAFQARINQVGRGTPVARLVATNSGYALSGSSIFVPAWHDGIAPLVACVMDGETAIVSMPSEAKGVLVRATRMSDGSLTADLSFDEVALDANALLISGDEAEAALDLALARGTLALSAQLEGLAVGAYETTVTYMKDRTQFGRPIADFQVLRHSMVDLHFAIRLAGASWRSAADILEDKGEQASRIAVSAAKARCSTTALDVCKAAIQYHGAIGYTEEANVGLYLNGALRLASWLGNASAHRRRAFDIFRKERSINA